MVKEFAEVFSRNDDKNFSTLYRARCYCGLVRYEVCDDPVDSKICHCRVCQKLHGAPMQWAVIFHKYSIKFSAGISQLQFYNSELGKRERTLPCKISCKHCGTLIADEGRKMWLAFPSLFDFGDKNLLPKPFNPTCHIFYASRLIDMNDQLPKWSGHKGLSTLMD